MRPQSAAEHLLEVENIMAQVIITEGVGQSLHFLWGTLAALDLDILRLTI
jgi:hypothetical protein